MCVAMHFKLFFFSKPSFTLVTAAVLELECHYVWCDSVLGFGGYAILPAPDLAYLDEVFKYLLTVFNDRG